VDRPPKPSFIDEDYDGNGELSHDAEQMRQEYLLKKARFDDEEATAEVVNVCYAMLSDKGSYLPLERVLRRLQVGDFNSGCAFPFSGFTIAGYVKAWWNQPLPNGKGERQFFMHPGDREHYRAYPDFHIVSSDD
jgi:hypothetical protein